MVQNPPVMPETWVRPLGWEDPLEVGMATYYSILAWRIPMGRGPWLGLARLLHARSQVRRSKWGVRSSPSLDWGAVSERRGPENDPLSTPGLCLSTLSPDTPDHKDQDEGQPWLPRDGGTRGSGGSLKGARGRRVGPPCVLYVEP